MSISPTRLAKRLARHREELTRFLYQEKLEGTNNRAERALRPAVVMRKITGGSCSKTGAAAWAKLASLMAMADQQRMGVFDATKKQITEIGNDHDGKQLRRSLRVRPGRCPKVRGERSPRWQILRKNHVATDENPNLG